ncbi:FAD-binding protein [Zobellia galactanivorans]|uniref:FAD-binding protein n=1 Tax=Zobellia galactanivorans (strain DSM 12802 / CCUG 47099 / CIP 106680 / NCIMB 13871 / Dsij) TaxID=63186 RepID=UPI001C076B9B|nr:FAD-binding protein [Zobellia galactanivorans]MBU3026062.1 FAD-binding protein [Zobellia galactanivorans]
MKNTSNNKKIILLKKELDKVGIKYEETKGEYFPTYSQMHNRAAIIPQIVVSPCSDWGVARVLSLLTSLEIYENTSVSVRSGGHGYFNGASCDGIMINLSMMDNCHLNENIISLQPGCILGKIIYLLHQNNKALPHGDCFDVHAGGHFTTAGWDFILSKKYGLGCQHVESAKIVLWSGETLVVNEHSHPDILWSLKGGAAAEIGVVTELNLKVIEAPSTASWCLKLMSKNQLKVCVANKTFLKAHHLPREISVSFRIHFEPGYSEPMCSFNVFSLFSISETLKILRQELGETVVKIIENSDDWKTGSILDVRMITASDYLTETPEAISEVTSEKLRRSPLTYWEETSWKREMVDSYFTTLSSWSIPDCDQMFLDLINACEKIKDHPLKWRMYILTASGGAKIKEKRCSMELGEVLTRFELHWDEPNGEDEYYAKEFTEDINIIIQKYRDSGPKRIYRGDIWLAEQGYCEKLEKIKAKYSLSTNKISSHKLTCSSLVMR